MPINTGWPATAAPANAIIVTSQPVTFGLPAYDSGGSEYRISFTSGPYKSLDDAKLARSDISSCPPEPGPGDEKKG
jgi:hypothetical protein